MNAAVKDRQDMKQDQHEEMIMPASTRTEVLLGVGGCEGEIYDQDRQDMKQDQNDESIMSTSTRTDVLLGAGGFEGEIYDQVIRLWSKKYKEATNRKKKCVINDIVIELGRRGCRLLSKNEGPGGKFIVETDKAKMIQRIQRSVRKFISPMTKKARSPTGSKRRQSELAAISPEAQEEEQTRKRQRLEDDFPMIREGQAYPSVCMMEDEAYCDEPYEVYLHDFIPMLPILPILPMEDDAATLQRNSGLKPRPRSSTGLAALQEAENGSFSHSSTVTQLCLDGFFGLDDFWGSGNIDVASRDDLTNLVSPETASIPSTRGGSTVQFLPFIPVTGDLIWNPSFTPATSNANHKLSEPTKRGTATFRSANGHVDEAPLLLPGAHPDGRPYLGHGTPSQQGVDQTIYSHAQQFHSTVPNQPALSFPAPKVDDAPLFLLPGAHPDGPPYLIHGTPGQQGGVDQTNDPHAQQFHSTVPNQPAQSIPATLNAVNGPKVPKAPLTAPAVFQKLSPSLGGLAMPNADATPSLLNTSHNTAPVKPAVVTPAASPDVSAQKKRRKAPQKSAPCKQAPKTATFKVPASTKKAVPRATRRGPSPASLQVLHFQRVTTTPLAPMPPMSQMIEKFTLLEEKAQALQRENEYMWKRLSDLEQNMDRNTPSGVGMHMATVPW
jgi:hypothetical protein